MTEDNELNSLRRLIKHQLSNPNSLNATKLISKGIFDSDEVSREQFIDNCAFTTKSEIVLDHKKNPPFGSNLTRDLNNYNRLSKTSGTSGKSISWLDTPEDWSNMLDAWDVIYNSSELNTEHDVIYFLGFGLLMKLQFGKDSLQCQEEALALMQGLNPS
jgi:phenylacetate-coenzyme A ligase PaaK-like adenylate-forming protein